jgi:hypothetical protein
VLSKRLCTERPEGAFMSGRTIQPRRSTDAPVIKKSTGSKKRPVKPDEPEELLEGNFGEMRADLWREFCLRDPYGFMKRIYTGGDTLFRTGGQKTMWHEHYSDKAYFKRGWVVHQHALHMGHLNNHI